MQPERIINRMRRHREPLRPRCRHVEMILQPDAKFTGHANHRLIAKAHALGQWRVVTADEIRPFMDVHADAVAGAVRQAGQMVVGAKAICFE